MTAAAHSTTHQSMNHQATWSDLKVVIFDKDGTLVDDNNTWAPALVDLVHMLTEIEPEARQACAAAVGIDLERNMLIPGSPATFASNAQIAEAAASTLSTSRGLPNLIEEVEHFLTSAVPANVVAVDGAHEVLATLHNRGIRLAMATNDGEDSTLHQIEHLGWVPYFDFISGYDSGWGPKPDPGMLSACVKHFGVAAGETIMVGDTFADIEAGKAAGISTVMIDAALRNEPGADYVVSTVAEVIGLLEQGEIKVR